MSDIATVVQQATECFDTLLCIEVGTARQLSSFPPGMLNFEFDCDGGFNRYTFDWISSVLYVDELLCDQLNFPYAYTGEHRPGLYECIGSSYLKRIQNDRVVSGRTFSDHHHFIYWDEEFSWHITCKGITYKFIQHA